MRLGVEKMKISKTTQNFADKRKMKISVVNAKNSIQIKKIKNRKHWTLKLERNFRGWFYQKSNLPLSIREELPYWMESEKHLREVIDFVSLEIDKII